MSEVSNIARETALARSFVTIAGALDSDLDLNGLFGRLTAACSELLGAAASGLMLTDRAGQLQLMVSSTAALRVLERHELARREGPCLDCYLTGALVDVDLGTEEAVGRWPRLTAEAREMSVGRVQALPMRRGGGTIGVLHMVHGIGAAVTAHDTELAQALADIASITIAQRRALADSETLTRQLQTALNDRIVIEQAKGLLAERGQLDVDAAFAVLRGYCRAARLPLTATAHELVTGQRDADDVLASRWPRSPA